jgi:hypothetical protein
MELQTGHILDIKNKSQEEGIYFLGLRAKVKEKHYNKQRGKTKFFYCKSTFKKGQVNSQWTVTSLKVHVTVTKGEEPRLSKFTVMHLLDRK